MLTADHLKDLLVSEDPDDREQATGQLVELLASSEVEVRQRGYALFEEALEFSVHQSCLNYRGLVGGFTRPLMRTLSQTVETWAGAAPKPDGTTER